MSPLVFSRNRLPCLEPIVSLDNFSTRIKMTLRSPGKPTVVVTGDDGFLDKAHLGQRGATNGARCLYQLCGSG